VETRSKIATVLSCFLIVVSGTPFVVSQQDTTDRPTIVFDYSHGQPERDREIHEPIDNNLAGNLTALGYEVVFAWGGLNSSVLADATGLMFGYIWGDHHGYTENEINAIVDWYSGGHRFVWVGGNGDFDEDTARMWANSTHILESIGSHLYLEPTECDDPILNCGAAYRVVANVTSTDPYVADCVQNVETAYFHGPTVVYGSDSANPSHLENPVPLENNSIPNVHPLVFYSPSATINDRTISMMPIVHENGQEGSFVAAAIEVATGETGTNVLVVSGASPYGDRSMCTERYYGVSHDGYIFVRQTIDFGMQLAITETEDLGVHIVIIGGAIVAIVILIYILKRSEVLSG
jgi:hypothetical protein